MHATIHEGKWSFQRTLCFGLDRTVLQTIILEAELYQICVWAQNLVVLFIACPCLVSHLLHDPGSQPQWPAQRGLPLLPSTTWAEDTKSLVVDRKLDRNSLFNWITMTFSFPPWSPKCWNICNFPQALLLPFPAHPVLAVRIPCSKISPSTWVCESKLDPVHCLFGWIFCPLLLPL